MLCHLLRRCDELIADLPAWHDPLRAGSGRSSSRPSMPGDLGEKEHKPSWPTSRGALRCSPRRLSPTTRTASSQSTLRQKEALFTSSPRRRRCHDWRAEQAIRRRREPQGLGREQTWGSRHPSKDDEPHPHRRPADLDVIEVPTRSPGHPRRRRTAAFRVERLLLRSSFIEMGE